MHDHRTPRRPRHVASPDTPAFAAERLLLLEIVADPPPEGDDLAQLAGRLQVPPVQLEAAARSLVAAGLAQLADGSVIRASEAAMTFDALWPICL